MSDLNREDLLKAFSEKQLEFIRKMQSVNQIFDVSLGYEFILTERATTLSVSGNRPGNVDINYKLARGCHDQEGPLGYLAIIKHATFVLQDGLNFLNREFPQ